MTLPPPRTLGEWVRDIETHLIPVEHHDSELSCDVCHGLRDGNEEVCSSCRATMAQVSSPIERIVPVASTSGLTQMHTYLRLYKAGYQPEEDRQLIRIRLAAALTWFLRKHHECVGDWDHLVVVPSSKNAPPHPLEAVVKRSPTLRDQLISPLALGSDPPQKRYASDNGFVTTEAVAGSRILLIDDTFTSGASVQSASSVLMNAGAQIPAVVVLGRFINPDWANNQEPWSALRSRPFDWDTCCVH